MLLLLINKNTMRKISRSFNHCFINGRVKNMSTVLENTIRITFVDREVLVFSFYLFCTTNVFWKGNRATVPARVGKTLLETAQLHKVDLEGPCGGGGGFPDVQRTAAWNETTYGEGPNCFTCHVQIPSTFNHLLPRMTDHETDGLKRSWEEEYSRTSRLACQITLDKKHEGMVVFVPDAPPVDLMWFFL